MTATTHLIPELDRKGLREFGLMTGGIVAGLFGCLFPWLLGFSFPVWPWLVLSVLGGIALAAPDRLRPVYQVWMRFGLLLSRVTTPVILGVVFFFLIAPVAFLMRALGQDPMARRIDETRESYRIPSKHAARNDMEKPF